MITFDCNFDKILEDLNNHKRDKKSLLLNYVNERLNKSLRVYYSELMNSFNYLRYKDELKLSKNINRYDEKCK